MAHPPSPRHDGPDPAVGNRRLGNVRVVNAREWTAAYARELGLEPPSAEEVAAILDLAAVAAHASERMAAPVACWLTARAGRPPEEAIELARTIGSAP
jgi:nucleotide-binding universal stress UspA family protein